MSLDFNEVRADLMALFTASTEAWPADYGTYAPFFVRMTWHCTGSYRTSDGRGGCDGGRQRFMPEQSWQDNTNLDKARGLLLPIKEKYGVGLSWGDLFVLAGNTAIESLGGPVLGFCAGRVDDQDGSASAVLGPTPEQAALYPCIVDGDCKAPLGDTTLGLIYVNPEGPMGVADPAGSAPQIRDTFARMGMNDSETVALIGGGHSIGKAHGACPLGPGPSPAEDPSNPWPGACGTGKGVDTFTSGFEGPWTTFPTEWGNSYFHMLLNHEYEAKVGPGGHTQWAIVGADPQAPAADGNGTQSVMMLTSDIALLADESYRSLVELYANDSGALADAFSHAWYKLTTRDMGPVTRCFGVDTPPVQPFQYPLPSPATSLSELANFTDVAAMLVPVLTTPQDSLDPDTYASGPSYGALFVRLAFACASTFRGTDYLGGCNGARIRFPPQSEWPANVALDQALSLLQPVKDAFGDKLSWADLIALAGSTALAAKGAAVDFCGGRTDALAPDAASDYLTPVLDGSASDTADVVKEYVSNMGLSLQEFVALMGGHTLGQMHQGRSGYTGAWTASPDVLDNTYYRSILDLTWSQYVVDGSGKTQYRAAAPDAPDGFVYALETDLQLRWDPELRAAATDYASDNALWLSNFAKAWSRLLSLDTFVPPLDGACITVDQALLSPDVVTE